jgi:hypothetical protein
MDAGMYLGAPHIRAKTSGVLFLTNKKFEIHYARPVDAGSL